MAASRAAPLDQPATSRRLRALWDAGVLDPTQWAHAQALAAQSPDRVAWRKFGRALLLVTGVSLVIAGVVYALAFNWDALHHFAQFGVCGAWVVGGVVGAQRWGADRLEGRVALIASAMGVGAWLAVIGQTYQTGANTWTLFATWAGLVVPWAAIGRSPGLWLLVLTLVNVAVGLWTVELGFEGSDALWSVLGLSALNGGAAILGQRRAPRWFGWVLTTAAMVPLWTLASVFVVDLPTTSWPLAVAAIAWVGTSLGVGSWAQWGQRRDLWASVVVGFGTVHMLCLAWGRALESVLTQAGWLLLATTQVLVFAALFLAWVRQLPPAVPREVGA